MSSAIQPVSLGSRSDLHSCCSCAGRGAVWRPARDAAASANDRLDRIRVKLRELRARDKLMQSFAVRLKQAETLEANINGRKPSPLSCATLKPWRAERRDGRAGLIPSEEESSAVNTALFEITCGWLLQYPHFIAGLTELEEFVTVERVSLERDGEGVRALFSS